MRGAWLLAGVCALWPLGACLSPPTGLGTQDSGVSTTDGQVPGGGFGPATQIDLGGKPAREPTLTPDLLTIYFVSPGAATTDDIYTAHRNAANDPMFTNVTALDGNINDLSLYDRFPMIVAEGGTLKAMYFARYWLDGTGAEIMSAPNNGSPTAWSMAGREKVVNTPADEISPAVTGDELHMVFVRGTTPDETQRVDATQDWDAAVPIVLDQPATADQVWMSSDGLNLFLVSGGGLYQATRAAPSDTFTTSVPVALPDAVTAVSSVWLSQDLKTMFFTKPDESKIYFSTR